MGWERKLRTRRGIRYAATAFQRRVCRDLALAPPLTMGQRLVLERAATQWVRLRCEELTAAERDQVLRRVHYLLTALAKRGGALSRRRPHAVVAPPAPLY